MFLDENYLLENAAAKTIFASIKDLPVVDAHNHADVKSLMKNECYSDMWQLFAATDHYVWETMRKCGVSEEYITGSASNHDKFMKLAEVFPLIAGNPDYEWIHLDLQYLTKLILSLIKIFVYLQILNDDLCIRRKKEKRKIR